MSQIPPPTGIIKKKQQHTRRKVGPNPPRGPKPGMWAEAHHASRSPPLGPKPPTQTEARHARQDLASKSWTTKQPKSSRKDLCQHRRPSQRNRPRPETQAQSLSRQEGSKDRRVLKQGNPGKGKGQGVTDGIKEHKRLPRKRSRPRKKSNQTKGFQEH
jgi:hypothetical protein